MWLTHRDLTVQDSDLVASALEHFKAKGGVSFSHCLVRAVTRKARHVQLRTFDRDVAKLDGTERAQSEGGRTRV